jgi:hypothetical protein
MDERTVEALGEHGVVQCERPGALADVLGGGSHD